MNIVTNLRKNGMLKDDVATMLLQDDKNQTEAIAQPAAPNKL